MCYRAIWLLLQLCFTAYDAFQRFFCQLSRYLRSYDQRNRRKKEEEKDLIGTIDGEEKSFLETCGRELSKLPNHVSIIIGPEENLEDGELISRIIKYALYMKIDFVSFYDARLEKDRCDLQNLELPKNVRAKQLGRKHLLWTKEKLCSDSIYPSNGNTNGLKNSENNNNFIEIIEVESFEGQALIGDICRDLFKRHHSTDIKEKLESQMLISQHLEDEMSVRLWGRKDPELCIVFNKYMCTFGMLPWQMRFTEFHLHQQANCFNARTFANILFQYARCEQRWGK